MKPDYLNDDEPEKLPPGLSKLKIENPFRVPDRYFDSLADNIQQKIDALPDVERMSKANPFSVPEGYFDSLPAAVQQKIAESKKKKNVVGEWISIAFRPKYALALAILLIFLVIGIKYLVRPSGVVAPDTSLTCEEIQNSSFICDIDESIFVDVLEQQTAGTDSREDNSIEQYLIDNNIDISQLENNL